MRNEPPIPGAIASRLRVSIRDSPDRDPAMWTLSCDPPGGDHPDPAAACAALAAADRPFDPVPPGTMCAQVYGGPQTATIDGVWQGRPVHATYSRVDACEIARWDALAAVFGTAR
jgi:hypothetical protein